MQRCKKSTDILPFPKTLDIHPEPKRDWNVGDVLSGHRVYVIAYLFAGIVALYKIQVWLWPVGRIPNTMMEIAWSYGSLLWIAQTIPIGLGFAGLLIFQHPKHLDKVRPINKLVSLRIVSRGTNVEALTKTIRRCQREMAKTPLFPFIIEVIIDIYNERLPKGINLRYIVVPNNYSTKNGSLYKARALQCALETSPLPDDAWIVHLDEESHLTSSSIKGICDMIQEEKTSGKFRIGQGPILYHRNWHKHPFLTLADNIRTGDDFARFYFQHKLGITVFGLHGSYIVVKNSIEKSVGFDFGPNGSITEDAFWALVAMEQGHRCRWVNGYLEEQSTQSINDFVKQRRRWFQGLAKVALFAPVKPIWRLSLGINTILWALAPFATIYTIFHLFYGFATVHWIHFLANFSFASFAVLYLIGLKANLDEYGIKSKWRRIVWTFSQIILLPVFSTLEAVGVLAAVLRPVAGFHVIKK